jgi:hypothetical protein
VSCAHSNTSFKKMTAVVASDHMEVGF